jgi:hypothetical protein
MNMVYVRGSNSTVRNNIKGMARGPQICSLFWTEGDKDTKLIDLKERMKEKSDEDTKENISR